MKIKGVQKLWDRYKYAILILLVGAGGYALAACIRLKREQVLFENKILYPSQCTPENCLDPEGYIAYIVPRMSLFGAVCVVFGIAVLVMSLLKVGIIATTVQTVIVLAVFVYISVVHNRASKIFW